MWRQGGSVVTVSDLPRRAALVIGCVAAQALVLVPGAIGAAQPSASTKDTFSARITAATGRFAGDHGSMTIYVSAPPSTTGTRQLTLIFAGRRCGTAKHCLDLTGRATGSLTQQRSLPDVGRMFRVSANGSVKPLGRTTLSGTIDGVGLISKGHEQLRLTLTTSRGRITLTGSSPTVPGFSSP